MPGAVVSTDPSDRSVKFAANLAAPKELGSALPANVVMPSEGQIEARTDLIIDALCRFYKAYRAAPPPHSVYFEWSLQEITHPGVEDRSLVLDGALQLKELVSNLAFPPSLTPTLAKEVEYFSNSGSHGLRRILRSLVTETLTREAVLNDPIGDSRLHLDRESKRSADLYGVIDAHMRSVIPKFSTRWLASFVSNGYGRVFLGDPLILPYVFKFGGGRTNKSPDRLPWHFSASSDDKAGPDPYHSKLDHDIGFITRKWKGVDGNATKIVAPGVFLDPRVLQPVAQSTQTRNDSIGTAATSVLRTFGDICFASIHDVTVHQCFTVDYRHDVIEFVEHEKKRPRLNWGLFGESDRPPINTIKAIENAEFNGFFSGDSEINFDHPLSVSSQFVFESFTSSSIGRNPAEQFAELLHRSLWHDFVQTDDGRSRETQLLGTFVEFCLNLKTFAEVYTKETVEMYLGRYKEGHKQSTDMATEKCARHVSYLAGIAFGRFIRNVPFDSSAMTRKVNVPGQARKWSVEDAIAAFGTVTLRVSEWDLAPLRKEYNSARTLYDRSDKPARDLGSGSAFVNDTLDRLIDQTKKTGTVHLAGKDLLVVEALRYGGSAAFWVHDFEPWSDPRFNVTEIAARYWRGLRGEGRKLYPKLARRADRDAVKLKA